MVNDKDLITLLGFLQSVELLGQISKAGAYLYKNMSAYLEVTAHRYCIVF